MAHVHGSFAGRNLVATLLAALAGCTASHPGDSAQVHVVVSNATTAGQLTRVVATATPGNVSQDLPSAGDGTFGGTMTLGTGGATIRVDAYAGASLVGTGSASVTVVKGAVVQASITVLDVTGPPPVPDHSPVIKSLVVGAGSVAIGGQLAVIGTAFDQDGDPIAYAWTAAPAGCGSFAAPGAAATTFTALAAGTCTIRLTVTANGKTDTSTSPVAISGACGGATCPPVHGDVDDLAWPPNGRNLWPSDSGSRAGLIVDLDPSGKGDILGLFYAGNESAGDVWYLLVSTDGGASYRYLSATNAEPNPSQSHARPLRSYGITQDTVGYDVHTVWWPNGGGSALYDRIALVHGADGHVSGWTWEAQNQPAPAFSAAGAWEQSAKLDIKEVIDGNGQHVLMLVAMDQPSATRIQRLVACRTSAGAKALAPTLASDWVKITNGAAGYDVVAAYNSDTGVDAAALKNLTNEDDMLKNHTADYAWAQLPADRSLHLFDGPMFYNDQGAVGEIRRWRFTASGANWVLDASVNGAIVAQGSGGTRSCLGSAVATANYVWLNYGAGASPHIDRVETSGAWTHDAVPPPETRPQAGYWWTAASVSPDEQRVYAYWEYWDLLSGNPAPFWSERSAIYDGTSWTVTDESSLFARDAAYEGATSWTPILMGAGVGVMSYGWQEWNTSSQHYHLHTLH